MHQQFPFHGKEFQLSVVLINCKYELYSRISLFHFFFANNGVVKWAINSVYSRQTYR